METVEILIADDHPFFRRGIKSLLQTLEGLKVVGEASTGEEAVRLAADLEPDLILMDLNMPGLNGVQATHQIVSRSPHTGILILTMSDDDDSVFNAMRAGARGYVLKEIDQDGLLEAIRVVASGGAIFSPKVATRLMHFFATPVPPSSAQLFPDLTDREREVLALIAQGLSNQQIAERMFLSMKTVRNYISNIFSKLQVTDRARAIVMAREAGLA